MFPKLVDRAEAFKALFKSLLVRAQATIAVHDDDLNPTTVLCSGPGAGKSRFMDEVASLFADTDKRSALFKSVQVEEENILYLNKVFDRLVPISITYGIGSKYNEDYDGELLESNEAPSGLALRVLFQFVISFSQCNSFTQCLF
mgnify:CR=1 FL=1